VRTFTHVPDSQAALHLTLDIGNITVYAEDRPDVEITLAPENTDDQVAADRIARTTFDAVADRCVIRVPELPRHGRRAAVGSNVVMQSGGTIIANGQVYASTDEGAISVVARVPVGADLAAWTVLADIETYGKMGMVAHHTVSGDLAVAQADVVRVQGTSGDVDVDRAAQADVVTVTGDVEVRQLTKNASVSTVSGDVNVNSVADTAGSVVTMSGDIRLTTMAGARTEITTRTVSGRVRRPIAASAS